MGATGPTVGQSVLPTAVPSPQEGLRKDPHALAGVESSLRVTYCRQILQSLPEHNYAVLNYLMGFLHEVSGQSRELAGGLAPHVSAHTARGLGSHPPSAWNAIPWPRVVHPRPSGQ